MVSEVIPFFKDYWQDYIEELATYDVVVFTVYTSNIIITDYIARYIKQINKKTQIWYGGPFSWYCKAGGLEEDGIYREFVDAACSENEGELIIKDLVDKYYEEGSRQLQRASAWTCLTEGLHCITPSIELGLAQLAQAAHMPFCAL